jgi:uncharacterized lipoprotein
MIAMRIAGLICLCAFANACASFEKGKYLVCPYDQVWEAALDTMNDRPLTVKDKGRGVIETAWTEMVGAERRFGVFQRDAFDNKERARMTVTLKPINNVTRVIVTENRERWHLKGGANSAATRWWPIEPSEEAMTAVLNRMNTKLKAQGCSVS